MLPPFPPGSIIEFAPGTPNHVYSNFHPARIEYEGLVYPTSEHAFQAAKTFEHDLRMYILRQPTAAEAKKAGKEITIRPDWDKVKRQIMYDILKIKFAPGSRFETILLGTNNRLLVEGNYWHDRIWGQCYCKNHNWEGTNWLGELLMQIRNEARSRI